MTIFYHISTQKKEKITVIMSTFKTSRGNVQQV